MASGPSWAGWVAAGTAEAWLEFLAAYDGLEVVGPFPRGDLDLVDEDVEHRGLQDGGLFLDQHAALDVLQLLVHVPARQWEV